MTCNASKFRSSAHRAKLARAGALSSLYPTFEGIRLQRMEPWGKIRRGDKVRVRRGAITKYKGEFAPYNGLAPVKVVTVCPEGKTLIGYTNALRPGAFTHVGDTYLILEGLEHWLVRCGITPPGYPHPGLVEASTIYTPWGDDHPTISTWLTREQIRTLVLAGRIRYERDEDETRVYLVSPAVLMWAGQQGYWREASADDCIKVD